MIYLLKSLADYGDEHNLVVPCSRRSTPKTKTALDVPIGFVDEAVIPVLCGGCEGAISKKQSTMACPKCKQSCHIGCVRLCVSCKKGIFDRLFR